MGYIYPLVFTVKSLIEEGKTLKGRGGDVSWHPVLSYDKDSDCPDKMSGYPKFNLTSLIFDRTFK